MAPILLARPLLAPPQAHPRPSLNPRRLTALFLAKAHLINKEPKTKVTSPKQEIAIRGIVIQIQIRHGHDLRRGEDKEHLDATPGCCQVAIGECQPEQNLG